VKRRWVIYFSVTMLASIAGSALLAPVPVGAVAKEIVVLQARVDQLIQGQQTMQISIIQDDAVRQTLIHQSLESVRQLSTATSALQETIENMQANSGARLDSASTQLQGVSEGIQEMLARIGELNQQLTDVQNTAQEIAAKPVVRSRR
jgi:hypothetical protein